MYRIILTKKKLQVKKLFHTSKILLQDVDLKKNLLYGGDSKVQSSSESVGSILFQKMRARAKTDKILQVCANSGREMKISEFLQKSVGVARGLAEYNINKGDYVMVLGNNSLNINVALIGILLSGAVPVPVSSYSNAAELRTLLKYIKPNFFICDEKVLITALRIATDVLGNFDTKRFFLLNEDKSKTQFPYLEDFVSNKGDKWETFIPAQTSNAEEDIAIVMKAVVEGSGSKGVGLTHKNINCIFARYDALYGEENMKDEVMLLVQKTIWMSAVYSLFLTCYYGLKLVVVSEFDEELVMKSIQNHKVTWCFLYPAKIWQLYKYNYRQKYDLSSCKAIYGIGARLQRVLIHGIKRKTGLVVKPAYAITEMTGIVLDPGMGLKEGSIGKLVPECYGKVVSISTHQRVGPSTEGELCFKGPMMMKGYVNDDRATMDTTDKEGFIHSGDYGSYDEEGYFFIIDKIKQVIKYQNHQLSPQELEGVIKTMDAVKDCVVGGIPHSIDGYRPIGFVVLNPGSTATAEDIIKHVEALLPKHKHLTGGVVFITKIPRSRESGVLKRNIIDKVLLKYRLLDKKPEENSSKAD